MSDNRFTLGKDDLFEVKSSVAGIAARAEHLGLALGIVGDTINTLKCDKNKSEDLLLAVLDLWLRQGYDTSKHGRPTWENLAKAVKNPNGGNDPDLAQTILQGRVPVPNPHQGKEQFRGDPTGQGDDRTDYNGANVEQPINLKSSNGLAIIVNCDYNGQENRLPSTNKDGDEMETTFRGFHYDVHRLKNPDKNALIAKLLQARKYLVKEGKSIIKLEKQDKRNRAIVFAFAGHGDKDKSDMDYIVSQDGAHFYVLQDIVGSFVTESTKDSLLIPKLFFFDACRGPNKLLRDREDIPAATQANFRIDCATIPTCRAPGCDAWMQLVATTLQKNDISLQDVMAIVRQEIYTKSMIYPQLTDTCDRLITGPLRLWRDKL